MSHSSVIHLLKQRKDGEQRAQDLVSVRLSDIERQRQLAQATLDAAKSHIAMLDDELVHLKQQNRVIGRALEDAQKELRRHYASQLPDVVYQLIFEALLDIHGEECEVEASGLFNYSQERAEAAFILASVCRRWRMIAQATPRLWDRVDLPRGRPSDSRAAELVLERVRLLLKRSHSMPIDILLQFVEWNAKSHPVSIAILHAVGEHTHRWRRVDISLPDETEHNLLSIFMNRTPLLNCLRLSAPKDSGSDWRADPLTGMLPVAPKLKNLVLHRTGMVPSDHHPGYPSLTYLYFVNETARTINSLLRLGAETIDTVRVNVSRKFRTTVPLTVPNLEHLILLHSQYFALPPALPPLEAPNLRRLTLRDPVITRDMEQLLQHVPTIQELRLCGNINAAHVPILAHAQGVQELRFTFPYTVMTDCDINYRVEDAFFAALVWRDDASPTGVVWPKLKRIVLESVGHLVNPDGRGLLRLVEQRNLQRVPALETACKFTEVVLDCDQAPRYLKDEISRILEL